MILYYSLTTISWFAIPAYEYDWLQIQHLKCTEMRSVLMSEALSVVDCHKVK